MKKILGLYIIHTKELDMRKPFCEKLITELEKKFTLNVKYIDEYETTDIDNNTIRTFVNLEKTSNNDIFDLLSKNIHVKCLSNTLKHYKAYEYINNSDDDYSIVIEDDVLFSNNLNDRLLETIKEIKKLDNLWHILMLGVPIPSQHVSDKKIINTSDIFKILPVCDSYFVNRKTVSELIKQFIQVKFITNVHLSFIQAHRNINILMTSEPIFVDGSKYGLFLSSLEVNNKLFLNNDYNTMSLILKDIDASGMSEEKIKKFEDVSASVQVKNHPDVMYLTGLFHLKNKNFEKCKEIFDSIYQILDSNKTVIFNSESEFLLNYCNISAHFQ